MREINRARFEAARQSSLPIGKHTVTIRRPSPWDVVQAQAGGRRLNIEWAAGFVVGWDLIESDLLPGGDPEPVAFDADIFLSWLKDNPEFWQPLVKGVTGAYRTYEEALEARGNA
jgi:hypothetical protein